MTDGGSTRTSNTGTVGRVAEANTIAKEVTPRLPTSMPGSQPTETQPDPVVAMAEFCLSSAVCRTATVPTDQYIG